MKVDARYFLLLALLSVTFKISAQNSLNYSIVNNTSGTLATDKHGNTINTSAAPDLVPQGSSNYPSPVLSIGFDFIFMGKYYTNFVANTNAVVALGIYNSPITILPFSAPNDLTRTVGYPPTNAGNASVLAIIWDKISAPEIGPNLRTVMTGTAPNRCRVVEWNATINNSSQNPAATAKFQMRLYEGSGIIEYVYGNMSIGTASSTVTASVGFSAGDIDNQFLALQNLTSFDFTAIAAQEPATQNLVNSAAVGNISGLHSTADGQRRVLAFTPPALSGTALNGLQVTETGATNVALKWNDTYSNELGYNILVSTDNVNFISAGTTSPDATFFTVGNLTLGNTYFFKVLAYTEGASFASNTVNATTSCFLNGTYTIGPGGTYTTLTKAIDSIKVKGVSGNVVFELTGSYTSSGENFPITFPKTSQVPCVGNYKVTVRPQASATNIQLLSSNITQLILIDSASYVIFDGRPGGIGNTSQLSIINNSFGPVFRLNNASANKFLYLKIGGYTVGPSTAEGLVHLAGSQGIGSDNNKFEYCNFYSVSTNPASKDILLSSSGTSGFVNDNDSLVNCNFYNFSTSAISLSDYNNGWVINSNSFYNTAPINYNSDVAVIKVAAINSTATSHQVTNNYFGGSAPNCQGSVMNVGYGFSFSFLDITGKANVSNNYFRRVRLFNAVNTINNSSINLILIRNVPSQETYIIENNIFGSPNINDSLHFSSTSTTQDMGVSCITMLGLGPVRNNSFSHIRCYSASTSIMLKVIWGGGNTDANFRFNTVGDPSIPDCIFNNSKGQTYGIYLATVNSARIMNNTICRITSNSGDNSASLVGIHMQGQFVDSIAYNTIFHLKNGNGGANNFQPLLGMRIIPNTSSGLANLIEGNQVYSLVQESTSGGGNITGIYAGIFMNVRKNLVHNLYTTNSSGFVTITGILMANNTGALQNNMISLGSDSLGNSMTAGGITIIGINGADNLRHNSVYIEGNNVADGVSGSSCFNATINLSSSYNNIFFNARSNANASSSAKHTCVNVGVSYVANYNLYYFTGTGGVLGIRSGTPYTTLAAWQAASGVDPNSIFNNPLFIAPGGNSNSINLHLTLGSPADAAGTSTNTLVTDFDNETRSTLTPVDVGADAFSNAPGIIMFAPTSAATGAIVTITGTNFTGATAVSFGGTPAASFTVVNATTITAVVGTGSSGSVSVTTPNGTASRTGFIFIPPPIITSFTPTSGGTGATIIITGTNFTGASAVSFGGTAATSYTVVNATTITAVVSSGASGSVSVTTPGGTGSLSGFTFIPAPTIISFTPTSGGTGATITITGTNFTGATAVSFGGTPATSFTVVNATTITAVVGTGASGSVSVTTPGGTASLTGFTYTVVTAVGDPNRNNSKELLVSPNPATDLIVIKHPVSIKNSYLKLIDMNGRTVKLVTVARNVIQTTMSVKGLASGIYKLIWTDDKLTYRRTIMIAHQ